MVGMGRPGRFRIVRVQEQMELFVNHVSAHTDVGQGIAVRYLI